MLAKSDVARVIKRLKTERRKTVKTTSIRRALIDDGLIDEAKAQVLEKAVEFKRKLEDDLGYLQAAISRGLISRDQARDIRAVQRKLFANESANAPRIVSLLVDRGIVAATDAFGLWAELHEEQFNPQDTVHSSHLSIPKLEAGLVLLRRRPNQQWTFDSLEGSEGPFSDEEIRQWIAPMLIRDGALLRRDAIARPVPRGSEEDDVAIAEFLEPLSEEQVDDVEVVDEIVAAEDLQPPVSAVALETVAADMVPVSAVSLDVVRANAKANSGTQSNIETLQPSPPSKLKPGPITRALKAAEIERPEYDAGIIETQIDVEHKDASRVPLSVRRAPETDTDIDGDELETDDSAYSATDSDPRVQEVPSLPPPSVTVLDHIESILGPLRDWDDFPFSGGQARVTAKTRDQLAKLAQRICDTVIPEQGLRLSTEFGLLWTEALQRHEKFRRQFFAFLELID
jgi:hypothetical protein